MATMEASSAAATSIMGFSSQFVWKISMQIFFVPLTSVEDVMDDQLERKGFAFLRLE